MSGLGSCLREAVVSDGLVVVYRGGVRALDGLDLQVGEGELFALVGPNGAGKTTAIRVFTTLLKPTRGRALVAGIDVSERPGEVRKRIGYVPQNLSADDELTGLENMLLQCRLYGLSGGEARRRSLGLLELVGLREAADRVVAGYSGGMRRRLELAMGLVHTPEILFLDEPTLGLDVQSRLQIWDYIRRLQAEEGITVLFTTHYMDEADRLSGRVGIIDRGKIVALGTPEELKSRLGGDVVVLKSYGPGLDEALRELECVKRFDVVDGLYRVKVENGEEALPRLLRKLSERGLTVAQVSLIKPSLDQVFVELTGREYREEEPPDYVGLMAVRRRRRR